MKLSVDLSLLQKAVEKMGAEGAIIPTISIALEEIDIRLESYNVEIILKDIVFESGIPSYEGRQVLLYIKDHSYGDQIIKALESGEKGHKFHIAECKTLKEMREKGKFDRYVVTNNLSGLFAVEGKNQSTQEPHSGKTSLKVCKYCLEYLNYKDYQNNKLQVFNNFSIAEFFETYSSLFSHMPSGVGKKSIDYTADWETIASNYKAKRKYTCERCGVNMNDAKRLLHVHHKNGVKGDNSVSNLIAVCAACHKQQPYHGHVFITREDMNTIKRLRQEQHIGLTQSWNDVYKYADSALHGLIGLLKTKGASIPSVGRVEGDLTWVNQKIAISLNPSPTKGWKIYNMKECLDKINTIVA